MSAIDLKLMNEEQLYLKYDSSHKKSMLNDEALIQTSRSGLSLQSKLGLPKSQDLERLSSQRSARKLSADEGLQKQISAFDREQDERRSQVVERRASPDKNKDSVIQIKDDESESRKVMLLLQLDSIDEKSMEETKLEESKHISPLPAAQNKVA